MHCLAYIDCSEVWIHLIFSDKARRTFVIESGDSLWSLLLPTVGLGYLALCVPSS